MVEGVVEAILPAAVCGAVHRLAWVVVSVGRSVRVRRRMVGVAVGCVVAFGDSAAVVQNQGCRNARGDNRATWRSR